MDYETRNTLRVLRLLGLAGVGVSILVGGIIYANLQLGRWLYCSGPHADLTITRSTS